MLPSHYSEAGLFKFHNDKPEVKGADKLTLGLKLIDKNGCNGCHLIEKYPQTRKWGPPLDNVNQKVNKEWTRKWIKDPQSFRFNTSMPNFFGQDITMTQNQFAEIMQRYMQLQSICLKVLPRIKI